MTTIRRPKTTFNIVNAQRDISNAPHRVLFVGQMLTGTATAGVLEENIGNDNEWEGKFGKNSHLANMIRHFRRINEITKIDAFPLADVGGGTAAVGSFAFTGPATAGGTLKITVGSKKDWTVDVTVAVSDTATTIATNVATAINNISTRIFDASASAGIVTITCKHKGTLGNFITLGIEDVPTGVSCTITQMASGATNPSYSALSAAIANRRYHTIVFPGGYDLTDLDNLLDNRFNVTNNVLDGIAAISKYDSVSNLSTWVNTLNQQLLVAIGIKSVNRAALKGGAIVEHPDMISAQFAAIRALRLTEGVSIAKYVIGNNGPRDTFGGPHLASLPYFNTPFYELPLIKQGDGFTDAEINTLISAGVSVLGNNPASNTIVASDIVTTYLTDVGGNPDVSFKYLNYVDTISGIREYYYNNCRAQYAQCRLTDGPLVPGYNMANADSIKAYLAGLYLDLSGRGYVLTRGGEENFKFFKDNLYVTLDFENGKVSVDMTVPIIVQLREILATIRVAFNTNR